VKVSKRVGAIVAVGTLTVAVCVGISLLYVGWEPGATLNAVGVAAMGVGILAAILLGLGISLLILTRR